ncbi:MAG TPA: hypothetical protein VMS64_06905 [Candidatus Methylomirabilis sp.]|nr:hypothetical protein [Candidatus Methylomirabilis sp.]
MSDATLKLRDEIIESQKVRTDLLKWKIILVAALGGAALGVGQPEHAIRPILLGFIPLVCAYVDVVCTHNDIRIRVIGHFLESQGSDEQIRAYESYCGRNRDVFLVERVALVATTVLFSLMIGTIASCPTVATMFFHPTAVDLESQRLALGGAAAIGALVSLGAVGFLSCKLKRLNP